jgi:UDP-glucose 4-epimerase
VAESTCAATAHDFGFALTTLRPTAVYGPGQDPGSGLGAVTVFLAQLLRGETLHVYGEPGQSRDYLHVADLAACIRAVVAARPQGTFEVGGPEPVRVDELVALLERVLDRRADLVVEPATGLDPVEVRLALGASLTRSLPSRSTWPAASG